VPLLELRAAGLYCAAGDFYIDPNQPVDRAIITHAHADHAVDGARSYLTARPGEALLRSRLAEGAHIETAEYGASLLLGDVRVSLHPAGHILGSAQIRLEHRGQVCVVSGDYKLAPDATCAPFEPLRCHTFVTESTFGLPIFRWPPAAQTVDAIHQWWRSNQEAGKASLLFAHALGKSQRILTMLDTSIGPIQVHESIERLSAVYRAQGIAVASPSATGDRKRALILAPPAMLASPWARSLGPVSTAMASGWMRIRGTRRRRSLDRGFVLSDHADWPELLQAIDATGAETVWVTHGYRIPLTRWLFEHGRKAEALEVRLPEDTQ
jgi:putative mRNA 3-end processing factor